VCVRCGTAESAEPVSPGEPPAVTETSRSPADVSYEDGYRDGESSRTADFLLLFHDADTMDGLLADFRRLTGDPELEWPVDWRAMFAKYAGIVEACEGITYLSPPGTATPGAAEWTPEEWAAISALPGWRP
jgi:hypothetical protein